MIKNTLMTGHFNSLKQSIFYNIKKWIQTPWNAIRFPYSDAIIWHFQGLRIEKNRIRLFQDYTIPKVTLKHIYQPYINELSTIIKQLNFKQIQGRPESPLMLFLRRARFLFRKIMTIKDIVIHSKKNTLVNLDSF